MKIKLGALAGALLLAQCGSPPADSVGPVGRVILITCDTLRADHLGAYGSGGSFTPSLDSFAAESVVYRSAHSCAPLTVPALSSLHGGQLPDQCGVSGGNRRLMRSKVVTLAERLQSLGWPTAAVVSNWVLRQGAAPSGTGVHQGFDFFDDSMDAVESTRGKPERLAATTSKAALDLLHQFDGDGLSTFFLWVHYQDPHGPYTPPKDLAPDLSRLGGGTLLQLGQDNSGLRQLPAYQVLGEERRVDAYRALYGAEVRNFDRELGVLFEGLKGLGWWEDSLVIFTADHGESMGEWDYWFTHGEHLANELLYVPLVVRYPAGLGGAQPDVRMQQVSHLDVMPTILSLLGQPTVGLPGFPFHEPGAAGHPASHQLGYPGDKRRELGVTLDGWKVRAGTGTKGPSYFRLHRKGDQPAERGELPTEVVEQLEASLQRMIDWRPRAKELRRRATRAGDEALRALGYAGSEDEND